MSRKFSIFSSNFFEDILTEIDAYIMRTGELHPYIFMNADTMKVIRKPAEAFLKPMVVSKHKSSDATLCGYKVFINDDLNYGVVEIR